MKFIDDLSERVRFAAVQANDFKQMDLNTLRWREQDGGWNVLECLEHLNLYGDFYLKELEISIQKAPKERVSQYKSGWLGGYLAKSMEPRDQVNKVKTFKSKNPLNKTLDKKVIDVFMEQQLKTLELLEAAREVNINTIRVNTSISNLLRLRLGDTFLFMINHIERHLKQADNVLLKMSSKSI